MCFVLVAWKNREATPLIIAANRDEYYQRPTQSLHRWDTEVPMYAGKDLQAGGTWFGIAENSRFAIVTNIRSSSLQCYGTRTRGDLVREYLQSNISVRQFSEQLLMTKNEYRPFNLLFGNQDQLFFIHQQSDRTKQLQPGIYALSNATLDTPWPKVVDGKAAFTKTLDTHGSEIENLFACLYDTTTYPLDTLPSTGVNHDIERELSARFINGERYGTRSSTVCIYNDSNRAFIEERNHRGLLTGNTTVRINLALSD